MEVTKYYNCIMGHVSLENKNVELCFLDNLTTLLFLQQYPISKILEMFESGAANVKLLLTHDSVNESLFVYDNVVRKIQEFLVKTTLE